MIGAFDIHYMEDGVASTATVLFSKYTDREPVRSYAELFYGVEGYVPGEFYRRELPPILMLLKRIGERLDEVIVDGYVMLADRPGLGHHLYMALERKIPVIGVAKSRYKGAQAAQVFRGKSRRPLYVTSAGVCLSQAAEKIQSMHGIYRIPTMLKRVDFFARQAV